MSLHDGYMKRFLISLALICSILFAGWVKADASIPGWAPPEGYRDDPMGTTVTDQSNDEAELEDSQDEMNMEDIFGDEQVFPFVAGLGK